jgi:hypothetical protein
MTSSGSFDLPDFDDYSRATPVADGPVDMLAAIAVNLGYHPSDRIVVAGISGGSLGQMVAAPLLAADAAREEVADMVRHVLRAGGIKFFVVGYGDAAAVDPAARAAIAVLERAGAEVLDVGRVAGNRYFSYVCADPDCCPAEGIEFDLSTNGIMLSAVLRGVVTAPSHEALVATVAPVTGDAARAALALAAQATQRGFALVAEEGFAGLVTAIMQAIDDAVGCYRDGGRLDDVQLAWLTVNLPAVSAVGQVLDGVRPGEAWHVSLWSDVTRRCCPDLVAWPAAFLAFAAWQNLQLSLARVAVARSLSVEPGHPLATLMMRILAAGIPPGDPRSMGSGEPGGA